MSIAFLYVPLQKMKYLPTLIFNIVLLDNQLPYTMFS